MADLVVAVIAHIVGERGDDVRGASPVLITPEIDLMARRLTGESTPTWRDT